MPSIERVTTGRQLRDFLAVAERLHADDPIYTPPLREDLARSPAITLRPRFRARAA